jgi:hypothetical protein
LGVVEDPQVEEEILLFLVLHLQVEVAAATNTEAVLQEDLEAVEAIQQELLMQEIHHQQVHHKEIQEEMLNPDQNLVEVAEDLLLLQGVMVQTLEEQVQMEHLGQF